MDPQPDPKPAQTKRTDLGVRTVEAGRVDVDPDSFEAYLKKRDERRQAEREVARAKAKLKDPNKGPEMDQIDQSEPDALEKIEDQQDKEESLKAKQDSDQPMQPGDEGYDPEKERQKELNKTGETNQQQELGGPPPEVREMMAKIAKDRAAIEGESMQSAMSSHESTREQVQDQGPEPEGPSQGGGPQ